MKIKFHTKDHILHNFFVYLLALVLVVVGFNYFVGLKVAPTRKEMYNVFIGALLNGDSLRSYIDKHIRKDIKEIHTYAYNPNDWSTYSTAYQAYGISYTDILILPENTIDKEKDIFNFVEMPDEFCLDDSLTYFDSQEQKKYYYGTLLFDGEKGVLEEHISYVKGTKYYLFVNQKSDHLKGFPREKNGDTDCTYTLLEAIINEKKAN